ncbi:MAG: hypothetical protein C0467_25120 [Planctomycetaceae bacterium]|nr:hypothetical protein [Planctomycetaceae bacterium]
MDRRYPLSAFIVLIGLIITIRYYRQLAEEDLGVRKTEALLQRRQTTHLRAIQIDNQQRRVRCSDPTILRYLEEYAQGGECAPDLGGVTYQLQLQFHDGGTVSVTSYWFPGGFKFFLPDDIPAGDGGTPRGVVLFKPPIPESMNTLIRFLDDPVAVARGTVLILDAGGIRKEYDRSLIE